MFPISAKTLLKTKYKTSQHTVPDEGTKIIEFGYKELLVNCLKEYREMPGRCSFRAGYFSTAKGFFFLQ